MDKISPEHHEVYLKTITKEFSFLKETRTLEELNTRGLALKTSGGMLLPVCRFQADDKKLISLFSEWRIKNYTAYPTRFPVTDEGTASWLTSKLLDVKDRILFMVKDKHGHNVGHLGFANSLNDTHEMEIDKS